MIINQIISTFFSKRKKSEHKTAFFFYKIITKIYSKVSGLIEDLVLRKEFKNNKFHKKGIFKFKIPLNANLILINPDKVKYNKYLSIYTLNKENLTKLLIKIFSKETRSQITKITGFNYSIDYFRIYENKHINKKGGDISKIREAHFDKAFSKNMLKIFIPLNIDINSGPLKVYFKNSLSLSKNNEKNRNFEILLGNGSDLYGVTPNSCWHQEGNPDKNLTAKQIMIQLNPSKRWQYRTDLANRQLMGEDKFTSFKTIFSRSKRKL